MRAAIAAALAAGLMSVCAHAEDLSGLSWTGPFFGPDIGYERSHRTSTTHNSGTGAVTGRNESTTQGPYGGFHGGYDFMLGERFVAGAELDFNRSGRFKRTFVYSGSSVTDVTSKSEWLGVLLGRLGYAVPDAPVLLVGEFGLYYSRTKVSQSQLVGTTGVLSAGMEDVAHSNTVSLVGGAGIEIRLTTKLTFRTDVLYSQSGLSYQTYDRRLLRDQTNRVNAHYVQIGMNYRF